MYAEPSDQVELSILSRFSDRHSSVAMMVVRQAVTICMYLVLSWSQLAVCMQRKAYAALVDGVKDTGGDALILSGAHVSGEQLDQLSGIAAILRFPLPDLEDAELDPDL